MFIISSFNFSYRAEDPHGTEPTSQSQLFHHLCHGMIAYMPLLLYLALTRSSFCTPSFHLLPYTRHSISWKHGLRGLLIWSINTPSASLSHSFLIVLLGPPSCLSSLSFTHSPGWDTMTGSTTRLHLLMASGVLKMID